MAEETKDDVNAYSAFCYEKHTPKLSPGDDGYCSGSCNGHCKIHPGDGHICNACGKGF